MTGLTPACHMNVRVPIERTASKSLFCRILTYFHLFFERSVTKHRSTDHDHPVQAINNQPCSLACSVKSPDSGRAPFIDPVPAPVIRATLTGSVPERGPTTSTDAKRNFMIGNRACCARPSGFRYRLKLLTRIGCAPNMPRLFCRPELNRPVGTSQLRSRCSVRLAKHRSIQRQVETGEEAYCRRFGQQRFFAEHMMFTSPH